MDDLRDPFRPLDVPEAPASAPAEAERPAEWRAILPAPLPLPEHIRHGRHGTPSRVWRYLARSGALLFAVCRFDTPAGKVVLPYCCGADGWRWKAPPEPRPLYGLDRLAARPAAPVLLAEGEKAADAAANLFPEYVVMTWQGGSNATGKADWRPLAGRRVVIWPDNDGPGRKAAATAAKAAREAGAAFVAVVPVPEEWPTGWDLADLPPEGVTAETLAALLAAAESEAAQAAPGDALRADVVLAAAMSRTDYLATRLDMARRHRVPVGELDALRAEAQRTARKAEEAEPREPPTDPRGRADLLVNGADLPDTAAELAAMLAAVPHLFDRGGPARIARDRTRDGMVVEPLTLNGVVNEAHRVARPWMWVKNRDGGMERRDITLPERVARLYLDDRDRWGLRPLDGITSAPLLHPDGTARAAEGYDPETRLWCERVPAVAVPDAPSREDAAAALLRLRRHFRTFAFADASRVQDAAAPVPVVDTTKPPGADESAFLVALLTAVCRPCLWLAPGLLVRAPEYSGAGTGKGLLVRSICAVAFGARPVAITAGATAEEFDKRITAALMEAGATLFLDNVNSTALKSDVLASAITERPAAVRPLGRSATVQLNPTAFVAVTGNGLLLSEDMARRFLTVELDAGMEDPEARDFRRDFLADTLAEREPLLRDVLTIWRWGRQQGDALPAGRALGSFTEWARWCRDPLLALGCKDPAQRVADAKAKDPRRQNVAEIFTAWWEAHGSSPVAVAELAEPVRLAADPAGRGRQYLAARVRALDGTRAAGFVLTRSPAAGKWSPDRYALRQAPAESGAAPPIAPPLTRPTHRRWSPPPAALPPSCSRTPDATGPATRRGRSLHIARGTDTMKFADVLALRPTATDSASILAAIEKAEAAKAAAERRANELARQRAASLLTATDAEMEAAEREAAEARRGAERIGVLLGEMQAALAEARRREEVQALAGQIEAANALDVEFVAAWKAKYAKAAGVIRDLLQMEARAQEAANRAREATIAARNRGITEALPELVYTRAELFGPNRIMGDATQLPGPAGELHWHPDSGCFWYQPHQAPRRVW